MAGAEAQSNLTAMDPITLEVINSSLLAYADEMTNNFWRSSYGYMNYEVRDYAVGFVDADGGIMTQSRYTHPAFIADLGYVVSAAIKAIGIEGIEEGDMVISNDPVAQGQHLNNLVVFTPLLIDGQVFAFPCIRAHLQDVGGAFIGSGAPHSSEIFQEGIQLNAIKVHRRGEPAAEILRIIEANTRFPDLVLGDLNAQIAVCKTGRARLAGLVGRYGADQVRNAYRTNWEMCEGAARKAVSEIPDGEYRAESFLDNDGINAGKPVPIRVRVEVRGEEMVIDFSDMAEQVEGSLNSGFFGGATNVARIAFKCLTTPLLPSNEGCYRPLSVICPEGKMLNARPPAALYEWSVPFPTIIDTILKALAGVLPERVPAATRGDARGAAIMGFREETRKYFSVHVPHIGGHGARPHADGPAPKCAIQQGNEYSMPVELNETKFPIHIEKYALRTDSGGAGRYRGGLGVELAASMSVDGVMRNMMIRSDCLPWGTQGGAEGTGNLAYAGDGKGGEDRVTRTADHPLAAGARFRLETGGGGGYGDPLDRPTEEVRADVIAGYVSKEAARRDYGVVFTGEDLAVDAQATEARRGEIRAGREA